ncbi:excinuclease ABC subunit B [Marivita sp.]|uniref:excinuclease ABC subunit B n=1 Tax=Marivita sp. TaxID=2003365 RepID=UPI0025B8D860|nr:excinuclease ABC subunit B [Marivita sp.]
MRVLIPIFVLLAACATPQERCINDAAGPYRAALKERADIARSLSRGFDTVTEYETRRVFTRCKVAEDKFVPCWDRETYPVTRRVPVDRAALQARDAQLARDLPGLERAAERGTAACLQAFPEDEA